MGTACGQRGTDTHSSSRQQQDSSRSESKKLRENRKESIMMGMAKQMGGEMLKGALGGEGGQGGQGGGAGVSDKELLKEALKVAKTKDLKQIDPKVLDYAATRLQAGFRGWQTRQQMKSGH